MIRLQTNAQDLARRSVPDHARNSFDIEFGKARIKTSVFLILWGLFGYFGGHVVYMAVKKGEYPNSGFFWFYLGCWGTMFSSHDGKAAVASFVLFAGVCIHLAYVLVEKQLHSINDEIASRIAKQVV